LPYWVYFAFDIASRDVTPGSAARATAIAALYLPIVLIVAYLSGAIPAAITGAGYAFMLELQPSIARSKPLRMACAAAIGFATCALWALTFGQLKIIEFVGSIAWGLTACGVFAGAVLAYIFPREDSRNAAA
jgi:energy-converting hydrogenase Eha subunit A